MAKRWREIKSQKHTPQIESQPHSQWVSFKDFHLKKQLQLMYASERIKAFITDMFMINMPLLYLTTYVFLDGKNDFTHNQSAILACGVGYGLIISLFLAFTSQTPGYRYMGLKLMQRQDSHSKKATIQEQSTQDSNTTDETLTATTLPPFVKISLFKSLVRYVLWLVGTTFLVGLLFGLIRRDGRLLHDVLCGTYIIKV